MPAWRRCWRQLRRAVGSPPGARMDSVGASSTQQSGHLRVPAWRRCRRQLRRAVGSPPGARVDSVGASSTQQSGHLQVPAWERHDQGCVHLHYLVLVGASFIEQSGHLQVPASRRHDKAVCICTALSLSAAAPQSSRVTPRCPHPDDMIKAVCHQGCVPSALPCPCRRQLHRALGSPRVPAACLLTGVCKLVDVACLLPGVCRSVLAACLLTGVCKCPRPVSSLEFASLLWRPVSPRHLQVCSAPQVTRLTCHPGHKRRAPGRSCLFGRCMVSGLCRAAGYCQRRASLAIRATGDALQAARACHMSGCARSPGSAGPLVTASVASHWPSGPQVTRSRPLVPVWPVQGLQPLQGCRLLPASRLTGHPGHR